HPALALAADLLRGALVGVRAGLYGAVRDRPGLLVALATASPARKSGAGADASVRWTRFFRGFLLAGRCGCPTLRLPARSARTERRPHRTQTREHRPMAKKKAPTKKAAAPKKAAKPAAKSTAPNAIKEALSKSGLVAHIADATSLAAQDIRAVLGALEG